MDLLDQLKEPMAVTINSLIIQASGALAEWLSDRRNRRAFPHRLERCRYVSLRNPDAKDGLWKLKGQRQVVYVRVESNPEQQLQAARNLAQQEGSGQCSQ